MHMAMKNLAIFLHQDTFWYATIQGSEYQLQTYRFELLRDYVYL